MTTQRRCIDELFTDQFTVTAMPSSKESIFHISKTLERGEDGETSTEQHSMCVCEVATCLCLLLLPLVLAMAQKELCLKHWFLDGLRGSGSFRTYFFFFTTVVIFPKTGI